MDGMVKVAGACACSGHPAMKLPAISVPPQISKTGLYPACADSQWYSSAVEASPADQGTPAGGQSVEYDAVDTTVCLLHHGMRDGVSPRQHKKVEAIADWSALRNLAEVRLSLSSDGIS
eukprot:800623-Prorocentrum_minimum.AAC.1